MAKLSQAFSTNFVEIIDTEFRAMAKGQDTAGELGLHSHGVCYGVLTRLPKFTKERGPNL